MTVGEWLKKTEQKFKKVGITSPKLDAEIILSDILKKNRAWLIAHAEHIFQGWSLEKAEMWCSRREKHEPLAYIRGFKEFYGRDFLVSKSVLIPRPESEALVDLAKSCPLESGDSILDVGTGSGILGITLKLELPEIEATLLDVSKNALKIAEKNARKLGAEVSFEEKNILKLEKNTELSHAPYKLIIANLPYVDEHWQRSRSVDFEPDVALFSPQRGLWHYINFLGAAPHFLAKNGFVVIEADPRQQDELLHYAERLNFKLVSKDNFALLLGRAAKFDI